MLAYKFLKKKKLLLAYLQLLPPDSVILLSP